MFVLCYKSVLRCVSFEHSVSYCHRHNVLSVSMQTNLTYVVSKCSDVGRQYPHRVPSSLNRQEYLVWSARVSISAQHVHFCCGLRASSLGVKQPPYFFDCHGPSLQADQLVTKPVKSCESTVCVQVTKQLVFCFFLMCILLKVSSRVSCW
jgi:hypothetical protein